MLRAYLAAAGLLAVVGPAAAAAQDWTAAWGTALMVPGEKSALAPDAVAHATLRQAMRLSLGGAALRVRISNRNGAEPLVIGAATVGRAAQPGDSRLAGPPLPLRFGGKAGVTVAPGADVVSDRLTLATTAGDLLAVSLAVDSGPARQTAHNAAHATQFLAPGDQASSVVLEGARPLTSWYHVEGIEVLPARRTGVLVAIGDSITDGSGAGLDRDERWPDFLQRRLRAAHGPALAVVNAGIGGNRMLADGNGPRLLDRFAHDVLERPGVTHALVLVGVNDLGVQHRNRDDTPEARRTLVNGLEEGFRRIAAQAHARGVCLIAGTITPYGGSGTYQPDAGNDADRRELNDWLRASPLFDGVADFDAAVRDPAAPDRLQAAFDSGDRLHPSPAGYRAMADAVPLDRLAPCGPQLARASSGTIDLAGTWRFALDREDAGVAGHWQERVLPDRIRIPGILNAQGYGDEITAQTPWVLSLYDKNWNQRADYAPFTTPGQVKVPFLSQPPRHYLGAAWYQRDVEVPPAWRGQRVVLHLERPRWGSSAWIDGRALGSNLSLVAPHEYDIGPLAPGRHRVTVRVDSRALMAYRPDSHSISDSLGMSWNGIVGKAALRATSPVHIADAQVYPDVASRSVRVKVVIANGGGKAGAGTITANGQRFPVRWTADGGSAEFRLQYPKTAPTWDEFRPVLQSLKLRLAGAGARDARDVSFGFVQVAARGTDILVNGRPVFLRGTHHGGDFPLTGYPPTDVAYWKKIFAINKAWGINHVRFHSFTPPEAAFQAADEVGVYLQPEPGMWNRFEPGSPLEAALYDETERLIHAYGNHPSFLLLSPSNEPSGRWKEVFAKWTARFRAEDPRRLYTNGTGHTEPVVADLEKDVDYLAVQRIGPKPLRNKTGWFGRDYAASLDGIHVPVVSHEVGQWVAYPDFSVIDKFTGYLRPGNYEIFRESARRHGVLDRNHDFALASGRWQLASYKEEIEAALRTHGLSGYQLLDLHDYLGQGTALVGILDTFWEPKGYATPEAFRRFNGATVPLARLTRSVFTTRDTFDVPVEIAHYGAQPLKDARPWWRIEDDAGRAVAAGRFAALDIPIGKNIPLGRVAADLAQLAAPAHYRLVAGLDGTDVANDWNFWLYPDKVDATVPAGVLVTHAWLDAEARLAQGGNVLYLPRKADLDWTSPPLADVPVFWNRLMNPGWSRMLGLWVDRAHPALAGFPTADHMDWQWSDLVAGARAFNLERLPAGLRPIVQPIDDWNRNYRLGAVFEAKVGGGRLVVSTLDLDNRLDERPAARQLRRSLLDYMAGPRFQPATAIDPAALRASLFDTRVMKKLGATASGWPDAANVVDGDPNTYGLVAVKGDAPRPQPVLTIGFAQDVPFDGLVLMPRQNHRDHEGDVREWLIQASDDGTTWRDVGRPTLQSTFDPQTVRFGRTVTARWLRLTSLSGFGQDRASALADVAVLYAGPALPDDAGELEYKRSRSTSADVDEAGMDDKPRRRAR